MRTIYQENERDCGVSALAMLSGVPYADAFRFLEKKFDRTFTLSSGKIIAGLKHFGKNPIGTRCTSFLEETYLFDFEHDALLGCDCLVLSGKTWKRSGHWAVWDKSSKCIRDPYGYYYPLAMKKYLLVE